MSLLSIDIKTMSQVSTDTVTDTDTNKDTAVSQLVFVKNI